MPPRRLSAAVTLPPKKRRRVSHNTEEIIFNVEEREDYLSGFHKRKVQRQKQAKAEALKREREEKLAARKHVRRHSPSARWSKLTERLVSCGKSEKRI